MAPETTVGGRARCFKAAVLKVVDCNRSMIFLSRVLSNGTLAVIHLKYGKLAEWLNAPVLKTGER